MKIWIISDTHSQHDFLKIPEVDMVIHCGDSTNYRDWIPNQKEFIKFKNWFYGLDIKHKVLIAGNHDGWATKKYIIEELKQDNKITYLENELVEIKGIKIYGSPVTPTFNNWHFMKSRNKLPEFWNNTIPNKVDILVTHGPPKYILDLTYDKNNTLLNVGCKGLYHKVMEIKPKYHCFGHVHNFKNLHNQGIYDNGITKFVNASCVTDGKFNMGTTSNGIIIQI